MKKSKFIVALCLVALFIPTLIAVLSYIDSNTIPSDPEKIIRVEMVDINNHTYTFEPGDAKVGNTDIIPYLYNLYKKSTVKQLMLTPTQEAASKFDITFHYTNGMSENFGYYFLLNYEDSYIIDANNTIVRMDSEAARNFINTTYAQCLYEDADLPILTVGTSKIQPHTMTWNFFNEHGDEIPVKDIAVTDSPQSATMGSNFDFSFSVDPYYTYLEFTDVETGQVAFSGSAEELVNFTVSMITDYNVKLDAKWTRSEDHSSSGEATYRFLATIQPPAVFYLSKETILPGEFVVISAKNVLDEKAITFRSEPDIGYTPTFFREGDFVYALVPVKADLEKASSYTFTFTNAGASQSLTLNVADKTFRSVNYSITEAKVKETRTPTTLSQMEALVKEITKTPSTLRAFGIEQRFNDGTETNDGTITCGFMLHRTITSTKETYRHPGVDYAVRSGESVLSFADGTVAYVGTTALAGNFICIDHGWGLYSWYLHLSTTSVSVGDTVKQGDTIGVVGSSGFTSGTALHVALTVYDVPVCPYDLWWDEDEDGKIGISIYTPTH